MRRVALLLLLAASVAAQHETPGVGAPAAESAPGIVLDSALHHLGDTRTPEWSEASAEPEGVKLELRFEGHDTGHEQVLKLRHAHVDGRWTLLVNRQPVGELLRGDAFRETFLPVPAGLVHDGENELALVPEQPSDDIVVGDVRLHEVPLRQLLDLLPACITVTDPDGHPLPARITITDEWGQRMPLWYAARELTAVRDGLVYTADGRVNVELPRYGGYRVHATRGAEWSLAEARLDLEADGPEMVSLVLRREVDTTGWIAADTHLHTFTFSGHGDATLTERVVTLAGEGVELAIATDHNHNTDYRPEQARLLLSGWYTPVTGNEVTTDVGHFNAFPLDPAGAVPDWHSSDWVQLVDGMRAAGARVVILNHPRWPDRDRGPFGAFGLDHFTGARLGDVPLHFDAMEVMNATNEHEDPELLLADWFALLNRGEHIVAAGSSDSHTVGDPVGQARTYALSASDDPAHLDVPALCEALRTGHSTVSLGIFAEARVAGRYGSGDVAPQPGASVPLELRVAAPAWIHPREVRVFVDGVVAAAVPVPDGEGHPVNVRLPLDVPLAARDDAWLVCVVLGDGVDGAWWPTLNPYTFAATNPVWLDVDGDGHYTAPRDTATARLADLQRNGPTSARPADAAVLVHLLDLLGPDASGPLGQALLAAAAPAARDRAQAFLDSRH